FFDACRSERLLQHTRDAASALGEMLRVTRPGGQVVVADADWGTLSIDSGERDTERRVVEFVRRTLGNAFAGRELFRLFGEAGLAGVAVGAWPIVWTDYAAFRATSLSFPGFDRQVVRSGMVSARAFARFVAGLREADRRGVFFASGTVFLVSGVKRPARL